MQGLFEPKTDAGACIRKRADPKLGPYLGNPRRRPLHNLGYGLGRKAIQMGDGTVTVSFAEVSFPVAGSMRNSTMVSEF